MDNRTIIQQSLDYIEENLQADLTAAERRAVPYVLLANQLVCVAWFAGQEQYAELFETNKQMTLWLLDRFAELGEW
jgi:hypothetical protein